MVVLTREQVFSKIKAYRAHQSLQLNQIETLNLWGQNITDISILSQCKNLKVLSLAVNELQSLRPLCEVDLLEELYLRNNLIDDFVQIGHLENLENLRILTLSENPITAYDSYRSIVISILPKLTKLDDVEITEDERYESRIAFPNYHIESDFNDNNDNFFFEDVEQLNQYGDNYAFRSEEFPVNKITSNKIPDVTNFKFPPEEGELLLEEDWKDRNFNKKKKNTVSYRHKLMVTFFFVKNDAENALHPEYFYVNANESENVKNYNEKENLLPDRLENLKLSENYKMMDTMKMQHKQNSIKEIDLQANKEYSTSNYPYTPISNSDTSSKINNVSPLKSFTFNHNILVAALSLIREMDVISLEVLQVEIDAMLKQKGN